MSTEQLLSLVEYIAYKIGCTYISDLPRLDKAGLAKAGHVLDRVPAEVYPLNQWNDALQYIVRGQPALTAEDARSDLLDRLCGDQSK